MAVSRTLPEAARGPVHALSVALACAVVALQIAYPLTPTGTLRDRLTVATVVVFFAASTAHAASSRGPRFAAALVVVTAGGGFAVEAAGVATGLPFGAFHYTDTLGPSLAAVPVIIPLAWTMMGYPAYTVARRISRHPVGHVLVGGWALTSWDLFLDPQMVDAGHWVWEAGGPTLAGIPLSNFAGWLVVATVMMALLRVAEGALAGGPPRQELDGTPDAGRAVGDRVPYALYLWTYASSVLAHAAFFGLPASAVAGGLGMGAVVLAFVLAVRR